MDNIELKTIDQNINNVIRDLLPNNALTAFLNNGSKRIRSKLAINYIKMNNAVIDNNILNILLACEIIHNASLLHDDVIDNSDLRRGITTIGKTFSPNISILCGDYLISEAIDLLLKINNPEISNKFNNCVKDMTISEIKQYFLRNSIPSIDDYIEICKGKTAGLFKTVLSSCAEYLNLEQQVASKFGETFGIAFQIRNDFEEHSSIEDKKNNIHTIIDILGIEKAHDLLDNYKRNLIGQLQIFPDNENKVILKDIISGL